MIIVPMSLDIVPVSMDVVPVSVDVFPLLMDDDLLSTNIIFPSMSVNLI